MKKKSDLIYALIVLRDGTKKHIRIEDKDISNKVLAKHIKQKLSDVLYLDEFTETDIFDVAKIEIEFNRVRSKDE